MLTFLTTVCYTQMWDPGSLATQRYHFKFPFKFVYMYTHLHTCNCWSGKLNINISMQTHPPFVLVPFGDSFDSCLVADHFLEWVLGWNTWVMLVLASFHAWTPLSFTPPGVPWLYLQGICASTPESFEEDSFFSLGCRASSWWFFLCM